MNPAAWWSSIPSSSQPAVSTSGAEGVDKTPSALSLPGRTPSVHLVAGGSAAAPLQSGVSSLKGAE